MTAKRERAWCVQCACRCVLSIIPGNGSWRIGRVRRKKSVYVVYARCCCVVGYLGHGAAVGSGFATGDATQTGGEPVRRRQGGLIWPGQATVAMEGRVECQQSSERANVEASSSSSADFDKRYEYLREWEGKRREGVMESEGTGRSGSRWIFLPPWGSR